MFTIWALGSVAKKAGAKDAKLQGREEGKRKARTGRINLKEELTFMVSEKMRASSIRTSSRLLLIPVATSPAFLLWKDPTASTIMALGSLKVLFD